MKIAITGKGGVGKTTLSAVLSHIFASEGKKVIAVDADPDANLAAAFGISRAKTAKIKPIAEMTWLVEERTGVKPGSSGGIFKLNPRVDDIPAEYGYRFDNITLLITGKSKEAASGCYCPENVFLKRLLKHLIAERDEVVIVDMEAGIEHLTRGTTEHVDAFIVVVEPGQRSIQTAHTVKEMAKGLGVKEVMAVANKVRTAEDLDFIKANMAGMKLIGVISFNNSIMEADIKGISPYKNSPETTREIKKIKDTLEGILSTLRVVDELSAMRKNSDKKTLRQETLLKRDAISENIKEEKDTAIRQRIIRLPEFTDAKTIFFYASFRSEVDTMEMIKITLGQGKRAILPKVDKENKMLKLYEIKDMNELAKGYVGILEPSVSEERLTGPDDIDLVIIPGAALDVSGNRLGYGAGFYDKLLAGMKKKIPIIAPAYEEQIVENIPSEPHDVKVTKIVTDMRVIECKGE